MVTLCGKLWPTLPLLAQYKKLKIKQHEVPDNNDVETIDLEKTIAELLSDELESQTVDDMNNWHTGNEEENFQLLTDEEIIINVLVDNDKEKEEPIVQQSHAVKYSNAVNAFNTLL